MSICINIVNVIVVVLLVHLILYFIVGDNILLLRLAEMVEMISVKEGIVQAFLTNYHLGIGLYAVNFNFCST